MTFRMFPDVGCCTDEMAHAMSRLDGYDHDRDMPTLQRWKDYWDAAVMAAPTVSKDAEQLDRVFIGKGEYVRADEAERVIADLRRNLRHWREECGKLRSKPVAFDHGPNCGCHYCT